MIQASELGFPGPGTVMAIIPLILSGGAGTRLWPASRDARPKQFLDLFGPLSTFQDTLKRVSDPSLFAPPVVMTNRDHRFLVREQAQALGVHADILLEPVRRDSGPAILAGAHFAAERYGPDCIVLALAADHIVRKPEAFLAACRLAEKAAMEGGIVTFGIVPDRPATAYGYIKPASGDAQGVRKVEAFVEKPDAATAAAHIQDGYLWNSGNFMFRADVLIAEYARVDAASEKAVGVAIAQRKKDLEFLVLDEATFGTARAISIDYAVMEKTNDAYVVPVEMGWSDVGDWDATWTLLEKDARGNAARGPVKFANAERNLVLSDRVLTAVIGVSDLAVVATEDAILIGRKDDAAALKSMVADIRKSDPALTEAGARVYRPWGSYQSLDSGDRYQVKRIVVTPGGRLSLQKHAHRSEHWIVVKGTAEVTIGEKIMTVHENQSVYVPQGAVHRLENTGKINLELIEVQTGSYLGEDDIVRLDDVYNRIEKK
jgi:mannose-1-phosphate guanylyltransferase/mannose-6-phosphate isomerase